jgi:hypothetical protein
VKRTRVSLNYGRYKRKSLFAYFVLLPHTTFCSMRAATRQQFIIDSLDVWLPAANLGLVNLNDGTLGIFG